MLLKSKGNLNLGLKTQVNHLLYPIKFFMLKMQKT